jgi:hypothetical protein
MARYQNGLLIDTPCGHAFSRWLVEFATQVLGWALYDDDDAGWTSVVDSGADLATTTNADELDFSGAAHTLVAGDAGRYVTMLGNAGWSAAEKEMIGVYKILWVNTTAQIAHVDIKRGIHENGLPLSKSSITYRLWHPGDGDIPGNTKFAILRTQYLHTPAEPNLDVKVESAAVNTQQPFVAIGPFGTWDNVGHAWVGSRNTTDRQPWASGSTKLRVWAFGDETDNDHFVVMVYDMINNEIIAYSLGAITPTAGTGTDTNPGIILTGNNPHNSQAWGLSAPGNIPSGARWMAYNSGADDVETTGYLMGPSAMVGIGVHFFTGNRLYSQWSRNIYRIEPMLQGRTASHMEARGVPKSLWLSGLYQALTPFGASPYYLHFNGGLSIPWNGSKVHVQWNNK